MSIAFRLFLLAALLIPSTDRAQNVFIRIAQLPAWSIRDSSAKEPGILPGAGSGSILFDIELSSFSSETVEVDVSTSDGTAVAGEDYEPLNKRIVFGPLHTTDVIALQLLDEAEREPSETFSLHLSNPSSKSTIADGQAIGIILDLDTPSIEFQDVSQSCCADRIHISNKDSGGGKRTESGEPAAGLWIGNGSGSR